MTKQSLYKKLPPVRLQNKVTKDIIEADTGTLIFLNGNYRISVKGERCNFPMSEYTLIKEG